MDAKKLKSLLYTCVGLDNLGKKEKQIFSELKPRSEFSRSKEEKKNVYKILLHYVVVGQEGKALK